MRVHLIKLKHVRDGVCEASVLDDLRVRVGEPEEAFGSDERNHGRCRRKRSTTGSTGGTGCEALHCRVAGGSRALDLRVAFWLALEHLTRERIPQR